MGLGAGLEQAKASDLLDGFAVDALLGNWDVAGLSGDNVLKLPNGKFMRIDPGGALLFRATGKRKGDAFGNVVTELESLRDPMKNASASKLFANLSDSDIRMQINMLEKALDMRYINSVVKASGINDADAKEIKEKLQARLKSMQQWAEARAVSNLTVKNIESKAREVYEKATEEEKQAMKSYTGSGFNDMRNELVKGKVSAKSKALSKYLKEMDPHVGWLGRGHLRMHDVNLPDIKEDIEKWISGEYAYMEHPQFLSTSPVPGKEWNQYCKIYIKSKGKHAGGYIGKTSSIGYEREYLIDHHSKFRITGWFKDENELCFWMEEAGDIPDSQEPPPFIDVHAFRRQWINEYRKNGGDEEKETDTVFYDNRMPDKAKKIPKTIEKDVI
jgi:hypothetical protein